MRRRLLAGLVAGALLALPGPAGAQTSAPPGPLPVTVEPGPATVRDFAPACSDVVFLGIEEQLSFVLTRAAAAGPLAVAYRLSGSAQPGVHYEPLPGWALFPPGATSVAVAITPRTTPFGAVVSLTMEVVPSADRATITFVSPPAPGPHECGYRFTADPWNTWQSIPVGATPHALTLEQLTPPEYTPANGVFRVVGGSLPPGVALAPDGSFTGAAAAAGAWRAHVEACRPGPPGTCVTTSLVVMVTPGWLAAPPAALPVCLPWLPPPWSGAC